MSMFLRINNNNKKTSYLPKNQNLKIKVNKINEELGYFSNRKSRCFKARRIDLEDK